MDLLEAIGQRHSVRSYEDRPIEAEAKEELEKYIEELNEESGLHMQLITDEPKAFTGLKVLIVAGYGSFKGLKNYIALIGKKGADLHENCGYFEEPRSHHRIDMHTIPFSSVHSPLSFDALLQGLKDIGYQGTFNFEYLVPAKKFNANFVYQGERVTKLQMLPLSLWQKFNAVMYDVGRYMLEAYGLFEE